MTDIFPKIVSSMQQYLKHQSKIESGSNIYRAANVHLDKNLW